MKNLTAMVELVLGSACGGRYALVKGESDMTSFLTPNVGRLAWDPTPLLTRFHAFALRLGE